MPWRGRSVKYWMVKNTFMKNNLTKRPRKGTRSVKNSTITKPLSTKIAERKRAEERLERLNDCLLGFGADPNRNINQLVALCGEQLQATCALYNRLQNGMLQSIGQWNTPPNFTSIDKPDGHICYDIIQSSNNEIKVIRNLQKTVYAQTDPNVMCYKLKTYVGMPVSFEGNCVGSLCVVYQEDYNPGDDDKEFLEIIAFAIGVEEKRKQAEEALKRSEEATKRMAQENAIMAEIGQIVSSTLNVEEVYGRFAEEARRLIPFDGIAINIINYKKGNVTVPYVVGTSVPGCQPGDVLPLESSVTGDVARTRSGLIIQTEDKNELQARFPTLLTAFETGLRSVIAVPLISKDQVIGAIHFRSSKPYAYSDQNLKLAENIASQIAGAIANAQLFNERKRAENRLAKLNECFLNFGSNSEENINRLLANCGELMNAACALYNCLEGNILRSVGEWNPPPDFNPVDTPEGHICYDVIQQSLDSPVVIRNLQNTPYFQTDPNVKQYGLHTYVGMAVKLRQIAIGSLCVVYQADIEPSPEELNLMSIIATAIGIEEERKRSLQTIQQSEARYRTILENIEDGYFEVDIAGNYTFFNDSLCRMLGYSRDEMVGMNNRQYTDQENAQKLYQAFNKVYRTGEPTKGFDWEIIRKDGTKRYIETSVSLIKNISGQPIGFRGIVRDITEHKNNDEKILRQSTLLDGVNKVLIGALTCQTEGEIANKCLNVAQALTKSKFGFIGEMNQAGRFDTLAMSDPGWEACRIPRSDSVLLINNMEMRGIWASVLKEERSLIVNDPVAHPNRVGTPEGHPVLTSFLGVPLKHMRKTIGMIALANKETGYDSIDQNDIETLCTVFVEALMRKRAEEALNTQKQRFQTLSEQAPFGMVMIDQNGTFRYINPKFKELFGYDLTDVPDGKTWFRKAYPDPIYRHNVISDWINDLKSFKPGVKRPRTFIVTCKDGAEKTINFIPVWLLTGENLMACEDITERKRAEEALQESEERYRTILENIEDGYYEVDLPGNFTFFNDSLCRMLGYSKEEMIGMSNQQYTDQENRKKLFQAFNEVYRTGEPTKRFDWEVIRKDRTKLFGEVSASLIKDPKGQPIGFRGIARDITERMMAGQALEKSEVRFQELFNDAPVGYFEYDVEGRIIDVNRTELELLGYRLEEMIGQPVWKFIVEGEAAHQQILQKLAGTLPPTQGLERTYRRKDGTTFPVLIGDRILRDSEGKIIGIRTTIQDITGRKRAEEEMRGLEEQFRQSQKMEAIGRLGGGIAHDFNNLLTIIKGYSQLSLLDIKESDPLWGNIQEIQKATQRATDLTRQLLAFSRRQILDLKVLDLNTLLKDLDKMLRRIIGEDIELTTLLAKNLGRVKIDPGQFEQIILNLAVNARDAMPSGGKLTIETANVILDEEYARTHISVTPGPYVRLSVSDTGVGIPLEVKEKVFEPFFTTKEKGKGTGLGLSTVYGIVKQSGGNIWVYSEPAHGTTFKIYLPRVEEDLDTLYGRDETDFLPRGSETVLLVEDEPSVRDLAHRLLNQAGYKVLEAANGEEALRVVQEHIGEKIHLLLTDVVMPQMGGKELANQLKNLRPDVKVLYTSGYTDDAIVHHGVLDPGTHFLQKPFSPKTLTHKVREVLDR